MNHKRKRRKNARAGCSMWKWYKTNGFKGTLSAQTQQEKRARMSDRLRNRQGT